MTPSDGSCGHPGGEDPGVAAGDRGGRPARDLLTRFAPVQAVLIQAVVMFLVLAATTAVIALVRRLFTPTTG